MKTRRRSPFAWSIVPLVLLHAGCRNVFEDLSTKNTNDAYYADARAAMNDRDYTTALTKLLATTPSYQSRREVILTIASAYAGRCGLDVLSLVQSLANNTTARLFPLLVQNFKGATTGHIADCASAQAYVRQLAPANDFTQLSPDEGMFLAVASIAKVGAILGTYADLNQDGVPDASFDACNTTKLPDAERRDVGAAMNLALAGLKASGSTKLGGATGGFASACAALPPGQNFCGTYDPAGFTVPMDSVLGGLINAGDVVGLGVCAGTFASCACP